MRAELLHRRIESLRRHVALPAELVASFTDWLESRSGWELERLNPLRVADEQGWDPGQTTSMFIAAARAGLLDFEWNLICPGCGAVTHSLRQLDAIQGQVHCVVCDRDVPANLDEMVEVAFNVVHDISPRELDPYASDATYERAFMSRNFEPGPRIVEAIGQAMKHAVLLGPGEESRVTLEVAPGLHNRVISLDRSAVTTFAPPTQRSAPYAQTWRLTPDGFDTPAELPEGTATITLENATGGTAGIWVTQFDRDVMVALFGTAGMHPFLTANRLLCHQTYRDLFSFQGQMADLRLHVRSLTVLFTDLRDSTSMYEKIGDLAAYRLVHEHFGTLRGAISSHEGAVVKTMGDAIMATFTDPLDGMRAASAMIRGIQGLNDATQPLPLGLKVGVHEGPALVIEADNRLDYFGQTINMAARIQGKAHADEICFSEPVLTAPGIEEWLSGEHVRPRQEQAELKGIGAPVTIYRAHFDQTAGG